MISSVTVCSDSLEISGLLFFFKNKSQQRMNKIIRRINRYKVPLAFAVFLLFVLLSQVVWLQQHHYITSSASPAVEDGPKVQKYVGGKSQQSAQRPVPKQLRTFDDFASNQLDLVPFPNGEISLECLPRSEAAADTSMHHGTAHSPFRSIFPQLDVGEGDSHVILCLAAEASHFMDQLALFAGALSEDYPEMGDIVIKTLLSAESSSSSCHILVSAGGIELPIGVAEITEFRRRQDSQHTHLLLSEGYTLCFDAIKSHISVQAMAAVGVLHALRTLLSLAVSSNPNSLFFTGGCIANDVPKLSWRGQHFDTARHFHGKETIFSILREMGRSKMNVFHWHLSDDQGWRIESFKHPALHQIGGRRGPALNGKRFQKYNGIPYPEPMFHTQADIREVLDFARNRHITIVPEIDLPAHAAALVAALKTEGIEGFGISIPTNMANDDCAPIPEHLQNFGAPNCMGGVFGMMLPTNRAMAVMTEILNEVLDLFSTSPYIHLGGDEAEFIRDMTWKGVSSDLIEAQPSFGALQASVMRQLIAVVERRNRTAVVWDETLMELDPSWAPANPTMPMLWRDDYVGVADIVKKYKDVRGGEAAFSKDLPRLILTPKTRVYFDYLQFATVSQNKYWPLQRPAPSAKHKAVTLKRAFQAHSVAQSHPIVFGVEGCLWTELLFNHTMVMYQLFPRMYAVADVAWSARPRAKLGLAALDDEFNLFSETAHRIDSQRSLRG